MRIAVVAREWQKGSCNGTQTSAVAFYHHALKLGHQASLVAFTKSGNSSKNFVQTGSEIETYSTYKFAQALSRYDAVFFSSVGHRPNRNTVELIQVDNLKRPFVFMVHGEGDHRAYHSGIEQIAVHPHCRGVPVVSAEAESDLQIQIPRVVFYPCTLPAYLLKKEHLWMPSGQTNGLIYAARIVNYKTPRILAELTRSDGFMDACQGLVNVYGVPAGQSGAHLENTCKSYNPRWIRHNGNKPVGYYDVYDWPGTTSMYETHRFYWDVFRVRGVDRYFRRWNLGAAEAARFGVIPIVNPEMAPEWTHDFSVLVNPDAWTAEEVAGKMQEVNGKIVHYRSLMRQRLLDGPYSFHSVQEQVRAILKLME